MSLIKRLPVLLGLRISSTDLARSQFQAFSRQIPLLYLILVLNTAAVAYTHLRSAPAWLCIYVPAALGAFCLARTVIWLRNANRELSDAEIAKQLQLTVFLIGALGGAFTWWGLALYPYGDAYARCHVAFFMSITLIGCVFCLMHMRAAALLLTGIVIIPVTVFFSSTGNAVFIAISLNVVLVAIAMISILLIYYKDFANLVESKKELLAKQRETELLNNDNFRLATVDSLTGLPNRRRFFSDLDDLVANKAKSNGRFAIGVIDLDGFKQVNDLYGHAYGDRVLGEVGRRLASFSNSDVMIARLGGDEFGLLLAADADAYLQKLGASICESIRKPYVWPDTTVRLSCSAGLASFSDAGQTGSQLFERADFALYFAKDRRRGAAVIFSSEHETQITRISEIEQALRRADLSSEMSLAFQPIADTESKRVVSFEALARWTSPSLGHVAPVDFIGVAERSGLIHGPVDMRISFNLSALDITSPTAPERISDIIRSSGVVPERIDFEITETALITDYEQASAALRLLKKIGICISLDDFGTGYSSLSYLHRLPIDKIKIDRSFVCPVEDEPSGRDIVKSIVDLCKNLNLTCIVEGVETEAQADILWDLGCRFMQGYFFGRPTSQPDVLKLLSSSCGLVDLHATT
jgi:diguanylate cyclase (GGDEF)-like protein